MGRALGEFRVAAFRGGIVLTLAILLGIGAAFAQSGDSKAQDQSAKPNVADAAKEGQRKTDEFVEAAKTLNGSAGNPE